MTKQEIRCDVCTASCNSAETVEITRGGVSKKFDFCSDCKKRLDDAFEKMMPDSVMGDKSFSLEALNLVMNRYSLSPKNIVF